MDEDQAYRAMDLLIEADAQAQVQEAVFFDGPRVFRTSRIYWFYAAAC
jgi:hypothetical protein